MSNFKIVCGTNPKDEIIINLDKVREVVLDNEYIENSMCVRIYGEDGDVWNFETDLECLSEVMYCLEFGKQSIVFTSEFVNKHSSLTNEIEKLKVEVSEL